MSQRKIFLNCIKNMPNLESAYKILSLTRKIFEKNFSESPKIMIQTFLKKMQHKTYQKVRHKAKHFQNTNH